MVIKPKVIVTLGRFAMNFFLPSAFISKTHGKQQNISWFGMDIVLFPMYHPAAALRNGKVLQDFKSDFLRLPEIIKELGKIKQSTSPKQETLF